MLKIAQKEQYFYKFYISYMNTPSCNRFQVSLYIGMIYGLQIRDSKKRAAKLVVMACLLLAVFLKSVIPAGFMPDSKNGFVKLVICSGAGEQTIFVPSEDAPFSDHSDDGHGKNICAYQVVSSGKILIDPPAFNFILPSVVSYKSEFPSDHINSAPLSSPFTARGPPAISQI